MELADRFRPGRREEWLPHLYLAVAVLVAASAWMLVRFCPPELAAFYPKCPFYEWTGLLCPGCGGTRALTALLHGQVTEALHWNGLVLAALAAAVAAGMRAYLRAIAGKAPAWPKVTERWVFLALAALLMFGVARNLT